MREGSVIAWITDSKAQEDAERREYLARAIAASPKPADFQREPIRRTAPKASVTASPGDRFGEWVVLAYVGQRKSSRHADPLYHCRCSCLREFTVSLWSLRRKNNPSTRCRPCALAQNSAARWRA